MRRTVVIVAAAVLALFAGVKFVPWLTTKQDVLLSSPTSPPLFSGQTEVPLAPGQELCVNPVDLAPGYHTAHLLVSGPARLALTITAPGYSATARASGKGGPVVVVPLPKLARSAQGVACMRNEGSQPFQLEGNVEARSQSRAAALLDAIPRMSVFKPLGERFFWLLLALVVLAVPALVITALVSGLRED